MACYGVHPLARNVVMSDPYSRRRFIQTGTALLSAPAFLIGCGSRPAQQATVAPAVAATPDNPFLEWFSIDEARLRRVLAELGSRGADHAELYFQHSRSNSISMEDGLISSAHANARGLIIEPTRPRGGPFLGPRPDIARPRRLRACAQTRRRRDSPGSIFGG